MRNSIPPIFQGELVDDSDPVVLSTISHIRACALEKRNSPNINILKKMISIIVSNPAMFDEIAPQIRQTFPCDSALDFLKSVLSTEMKAPPSPPEEHDGEENTRKKTRSWTTNEDYRLIMGVHLYGENNWSEVSEFVGGGRTRSQCSQRWCRVIDPKISKEHWTADEEKKLLQLVQKYGDKSWIKVAQEMNGRSDVQCRYKYKKLSSQHDNSSDSFGQTPSLAHYKQESRKHKSPKAIRQSVNEPIPQNIYNENLLQNSFNQLFAPMQPVVGPPPAVPKTPDDASVIRSGQFSDMLNLESEKSLFGAESIFNIGALDL